MIQCLKKSNKRYFTGMVGKYVFNLNEYLLMGMNKR